MTSLTTNLSNGVTNVDDTSSTGTLTQLDPTKLHTYLNDFNLYNASDWIVTTIEAGAGSATQAIVDETGGVLELTNDDATLDQILLQSVNETFQFVAGKQLHFKARFKVLNFFRDSSVIGLQTRGTTTFITDDGVYFFSNANRSSTELSIKKDAQVVRQVLISPIPDDTFIELAFVYDGRSEIQYWFDDVKIGTLDIADLPTTELIISFGVRNNATVSSVMSIDYIYIANER